jgi:hypothetical protein
MRIAGIFASGHGYGDDYSDGFDYYNYDYENDYPQEGFSREFADSDTPLPRLKGSRV